MNQKKAKKLRRDLLGAGINWRERNYEQTRNGPVMLMHCGRAVYQAMKEKS